MKAVLISIKPKWCELIASGKKTIEVRKTRPKLETPFKCYIYCTNSFPVLTNFGTGKAYALNWAQKKSQIPDRGERWNGKVISEFVCDEIRWNRAYLIKEDMEQKLRGSCLTNEELYNYIDIRNKAVKHEFFCWHISDLKIYDKPKELCEFRKLCVNEWYCESCAMYNEHNADCGNEALCIKDSPQSWCYVDGLEA